METVFLQRTPQISQLNGWNNSEVFFSNMNCVSIGERLDFPCIIIFYGIFIFAPISFLKIFHILKF